MLYIVLYENNKYDYFKYNYTIKENVLYKKLLVFIRNSLKTRIEIF